MTATITPLPDPPSRSDPDNFAARADAFLGALPQFGEELEALGVQLSPLAAAVDSILAAAYYKGLWSTLTGPLAIPASVYHLNRFWTLTQSVADVTLEVPGSSAKWVSRINVLQKHIAGLVPSTAGASTTITVSAGEATDDSNTDLLSLESAISKTTSAWTVGSGNGGLDTGSIANSTRYYGWLIKRPDTGVVDMLWSLSSSAPTLPSNYTLKRLVAFGYTNGSGNWEQFSAYESSGGGLSWTWYTPPKSVDTTVGTSRIAGTLLTPLLTANHVIAKVRAYASNAGAAVVAIGNPDEVDGTPNVVGTTGANFSLAAGVALAQQFDMQTQVGSTNVFMRSTVASTTVRLWTVGFLWGRR